jgi:NACHT domain
MIKNVFSEFSNWKFDPVTSVLTMVLAPVGIYLLVVVRRFLKDAFRYLVDGIVYALNKIVVHRVAASMTLKRYCRLQLAGSTRYLRVPATAEINIDIDRIFIPLILENPGMSATYNSASLLTAGNRIRVIGDPGSGKSSAAKRVFRDESNRGLFAPARSRFPIFIELRTLDIPKNISVSKLGEWMFTYIRGLCAKHDVYNLEKCFDVYASKTGLLVILDGLDEVASSVYPRIMLALNALSIKLQQLGENNVIILTQRTQFHQQTRGDFDDNFPIVLSVKRFSPSDIYEFLTRWPFSDPSTDNIVRIYNDLTDRPSLREMCTNPLVLSMYVAQDQISGHQIAPDSRTEFYSKVADELLIKRRAKQVGPLGAQAVVREQRQRILGRIAFEHLCDPNQSPNHLVWSDAIPIVMDVTAIKNRDEAEQYLRDVAKETGLIGEEQERESFRFIHLTFCEFFCAFEAVHGRADGWSSLLASHTKFQNDPALRSRLVESLPFASALLPRHMKAQAIDQIASCKDQHLLAMTYLETKSYTHHLWPAFVDESIINLTGTSEQQWDPEWLRELHLFLVVASDAERAAAVARSISRSDGVAMFFRDFAQLKASSLSKLLESYAEQDAAAAFRVATLCEVDLLKDIPEVIVKSCSQPPFIAVAIERALREPEHADLWASLFAEGGLRSRAAAYALSARNERPWINKVRTLPKAAQWSYSTFIVDSFYTDCLTLGCWSDCKRSATPLLDSLALVPPPNSTSQSKIVELSARFGLPLFLLNYGLTFVPMIAGTKKELFVFDVIWGTTFLIVGMIAVISARFARRRIQLYQALIGLRVDPLGDPMVMLRRLVLNIRLFLLRRATSDGRVDRISELALATAAIFRPRKLVDPAQKFFIQRSNARMGV